MMILSAPHPFKGCLRESARLPPPRVVNSHTLTGDFRDYQRMLRWLQPLRVIEQLDCDNRIDSPRQQVAQIGERCLVFKGGGEAERMRGGDNICGERAAFCGFG